MRIRKRTAIIIAAVMMSVLLLPVIQADEEYIEFSVERRLWGENGGESVIWSPNGNYVVSQTSSTQTDQFSFKYYDTNDWTSKEKYTRHSGLIRVFQWSPDSKYLITAYREAIRFDVQSGWSDSGFLELDTSIIRAMDWHPTKARLACGTELGNVYIINTNTWKVESNWSAHPSWIHTVAWSPDGSLLATAGRGAEIKVWAENDHSLVYRMKGHTQDIATLAWSEDGTEMVSAGFDTNILLWDMTSGKLKQIDPIGSHGTNNAVLSLKWHWDRNMLISGGTSHIMVWRTTDWTFLQKIEKSTGGDPASAYTLAWSPDGNKFASASHDGLDIWSQKERQTTAGNDWLQYLCMAVVAVIVIVVLWWVYSMAKTTFVGEKEGKEEE